ncbi:MULTISPECIES: effector-associated constant component EACC1 [Streptomyces]|uniref:effector-associated constant component EACC1 n=1 Tax=Streptomyces TaxID=1883 RepID=UPI00345BB0E1
MIVQLSVVDDEAGEELRRLQQWLHKDDDLRLVTITAEQAPDRDEDMAPVTEVLSLLCQPQGVLTAVVASLVTWLGTRRKIVRIRVRSGAKEIELDASHLEKPADEVADQLLRELDGQ